MSFSKFVFNVFIGFVLAYFVLNIYGNIYIRYSKKMTNLGIVAGIVITWLIVLPIVYCLFLEEKQKKK